MRINTAHEISKNFSNSLHEYFTKMGIFSETKHIFPHELCTSHVLLVSVTSQLLQILQVLQCGSLTSSSAMESGKRPSWDGCGEMVCDLTGTEHVELLDSETDQFFSRFGRRPNRDATYATTSSPRA